MATLRESITAFYKNILGREPDAGGLAYWQAQVESGQIQLAEVVSSFTTSAEAQAVVQPIIALYQAAFGRTPDTGGLQYWVAQMQGGLSLSDVTQAFAQSSEFASVAGTSSTQFITALYQNTLAAHRTPAAWPIGSNRPPMAAARPACWRPSPHRQKASASPAKRPRWC
ncbi:DUF4214 domain-containing protein [Pseudomonas guariconensis]|uniref:DUF4214 domain-containing protein n=1 Tax=Pseudomonas guariconensis TaxID=1288410 RepID=UPI0039EBA15F